MNFAFVFSQFQSLSFPTKILLGVSTSCALYLFITIGIQVCVITSHFLINLARELLPSSLFPSSSASARDTKKRPIAKKNPAKSKPKPSTSAASSLDTASSSLPPPSQGVSLKSLIKQSAKTSSSASGPDHHASELFINGFRGHLGAVTGFAFAPDGTAIATSCEDRTLRLFNLGSNYGDLKNNNKIPCTSYDMRQSIQDVAIVGSSGSNQAITASVVVLTRAGTLLSLEISHKESTKGSEVTGLFRGKTSQALCLRKSQRSGAHQHTPIVVAVATTPEMRAFLATTPSLTALGDRIDTGGFNNYWAAISADGRFFGAATFSSDLKIYETEFDRQGNLKNSNSSKKVMDLKGHKKKITAVDFSPDSRAAVTASEDGTLRTWNIDVRYHMQEDPKTVVTQGLPSGKTPVKRLAWGPGGVIAAVAGMDVYFLAAATGKVVDVVENAHSGEITDIAWSPVKYRVEGQEVAVLASSGGDGRLRLWKAPWSSF